MPILDAHSHILDGQEDRNDFHRRLAAAGVDGCVIISLPPKNFSQVARPRPTGERLDNLFFWAENHPALFPYFWVDPLEDDAIEQVLAAAQRNVMGFKVTCDRFYPGDSQPMEVFRAIAKTGRPLLFHTGILWDGRNSSRYNHPENFEALLDVPGLRFCLAHISWPWCDELIAVYGKFLNAYVYRPEVTAEMYVDISPGTPPIYRRDALTKLFTVGYDVKHHVLFGSDCVVNDYNVTWVREWIERDNLIYDALEIDEDTRNNIYSENLRRFIGLSQTSVQRKLLRIGE